MSYSAYEHCELCPRRCKARRTEGHKGYCNVTDKLIVSRAALHMWEEPCISGESGSGTVFFTGCNMGCVFCQNHDISNASDKSGKIITKERLVEIFFELRDKGANNINLVTPDHFIPTISEAIKAAKERNFELPFLYNTSSYVTVESLKMLDGLIDIYLPDFKYLRNEKAKKYSKAEDYPEVAKAAIDEMVRQVRAKARQVSDIKEASEESDKLDEMNESNESNESGVRLCSFNENGIMTRGVIVRHLLLPGGLLEAKMIVKYLYEKYGDDIYVSLMNQYTPIEENLKDYPEINRRVTAREYDSLIEYAVDIGVTNGFMQEGGTDSESFIPAFDYEGV